MVPLVALFWLTAWVCPEPAVQVALPVKPKASTTICWVVVLLTVIDDGEVEPVVGVGAVPNGELVFTL